MASNGKNITKLWKDLYSPVLQNLHDSLEGLFQTFLFWILLSIELIIAFALVRQEKSTKESNLGAGRQNEGNTTARQPPVEIVEIMHAEPEHGEGVMTPATTENADGENWDSADDGDDELLDEEDPPPEDAADVKLAELAELAEGFKRLK
ncbi:MAG: hypothetical protein Q9164_002447 [Protoblastenia rupestris]